MPLNLASPGILVREVDLTIGRVDATSGSIGALVAPFTKGPVEEPQLIESEEDLLQTFGQPYSQDKQYEYWMVASSYLAYGGTMEVVRANNDGLFNACVGSATSIKIKSSTHYNQLEYDDNTIPGYTVIAKTPGSYANDLLVSIIDAKADQILTGITTTTATAFTLQNASVGNIGITTNKITGINTAGLSLNQTVNTIQGVVGAGLTITTINPSEVIISGNSLNDGIVNPITTDGNIGITTNKITGINTAGLSVGQATQKITGVVDFGLTITQINVDELILSGNSLNSAKQFGVDFEFGDTNAKTGVVFEFGSSTSSGIGIAVGNGFKADVKPNTVIVTNVSTGATSVLDGTIRGVITEVGADQVSVKINAHVSAGGTITEVDYKQNGSYALAETGTITIQDGSTTRGTANYTAEKDWFDQQEIVLTTKKLDGTFNTIKWSTIADKPGTSAFAGARGGRFDELHIAVIDDKGTETGNAGTILEKHVSLSKAKDAEYSVGSPAYWRKYLEVNSQYIYGGSEPTANTTGIGFDDILTYEVNSDKGWDQDAVNIKFAGLGVLNASLKGGKNYNTKTDYVTTGALSAGVGDLISGYTLFENTEDVEVDFILMGAAHHPKSQSQAIAEKVIAVAEARKDAVAFVSPYRQAFLNDSGDGVVAVSNIDTITDNVVGFYTPITSTTFGVFDSGYKYMFDRFNNTFRYVPLNGDIAGTCARTDIEQFPWFSPAGTARGAILNSVKLIYNPGRKQRDILYSNRINPVIVSPGAGIILFGDKTAFGKSSAFDRINVRRLFIFLEDAISAAAKDQLFEFNDELTRTNFVNIIEPFLREVQSNRGIFDFVVICDETNNTAAVIDRNEFVADIFIKPARSINFIGLTFVATRTGVAFEEVIGSV